MYIKPSYCTLYYIILYVRYNSKNLGRGKFCFGYANFEIPIKDPNGDVKCATGLSVWNMVLLANHSNHNGREWSAPG